MAVTSYNTWTNVSVQTTVCFRPYSILLFVTSEHARHASGARQHASWLVPSADVM